MPGEDKGQGAKPQGGDSKPQPSAPAPAVAGDDIEEGKDRSDHDAKGAEKRRWLPKDIRLAEWIMIAFTAVTALAAWAGVVVANGQLGAMRAQLSEMKSSSNQTERAIEATNRLGAAADYQGVMAERSLGVAQGQLRTAREGNQAQIEIELVSSGANLVVGPEGAFINPIFHIRNVGHEIAEVANAHGEFYARRDNQVVPRQQRICREPPVLIAHTTSVGFNVGGNQPMEVPALFKMSREDVSVWRTSKPVAPGTFGAIPMLVGCIDYVSGGKHHHTPFVYEIQRRDDKITGGHNYIDPTGVSVAQGDIVFLVPPWFVGKPD